MYRINIKPLSVNRAYIIAGKRLIKSKLYRQFEKDLAFLLPRKVDFPKGPIKLKIRVGVNRKSTDADNQIKPFQDILQHFYEFNDSIIYEVTSQKRLVKKGQEYLAFCVVPMTEDELKMIDERVPEGLF